MEAWRRAKRARISHQKEGHVGICMSGRKIRAFFSYLFSVTELMNRSFSITPQKHKIKVEPLTYLVESQMESHFTELDQANVKSLIRTSANSPPI